ncbi:MAG TPA: helix-turn-helix transcriptional regulator [Kofleriaceae bacterium]|jgi:DNA-binding CsgD family transcriptional regulator
MRSTIAEALASPRSRALQLAETRSFVDVAQQLCSHARETLGEARTLVGLFGPFPTLDVLVDDDPSSCDTDRLALARALWADPCFAAMLDNLRPIGTLDTQWSPLIEDTGPLGFVVTRALRGELAGEDHALDLAAAHATARLIRLGVTASHRVSTPLTPRQRAIADSVALGATNRETADALGTSVNTVKKHLKFVFAALGVQSRAELARYLARLAPADELAFGVTRVDDVWVTKLGTRTGTRRAMGARS